MQSAICHVMPEYVVGTLSRLQYLCDRLLTIVHLDTGHY